MNNDITIHVYSKPRKPSRIIVIAKDAQVLQDRVVARAGKAYAQEYVSGLVDGFSSACLTVGVRHHPFQEA